MLSGVGDAAVLAELGIRTVAHRPAVGMSLQDHVNVRTSYRCALPITLNDRLGTAWGRAMAGLEYLALGRGPLTVAAGTGGAFFRSDGASGRPDVQAFLLVFRTDRMGTRLSPDSGFMMSAYQLRPHSRGSIRLASPDPRAPPLIDPAYLASDFDRAVTLAGLRRLQAIASARPLADLIAGPSEPPLDADDSTLTAHIRASASPGHHFCGSCRMGPDPDSVVDPRLRVRGTSGLRVADASIMPAVVSGNTLAPVVAIAEKAADMILADAR
ncbi:MAG: GMC oxidoreductase [Sphingomonas sp.]